MSYVYLRGNEIPSYQSVDLDDPYALFFVVNDNKDISPDESEFVQAAVRGMVKLFQSEEAEVQAAVTHWVSGRIRKIVKRAKNSAWDKISGQFEGQSNSATVRVIAPLQMSQQPLELKKLQVSGLQAASFVPTVPVDPYLHVFVDDSLQMSTGKIIAQVCHAAQLFLMFSDGNKVDSWLANNSAVLLTKTTELQKKNFEVVVHDAGFTEVTKGSLTCAANFVYSL